MIEETGYRKDEECFIAYLDDDGESVSCFGKIISISDNIITFITNKNIITISANRLLKIKQKKEGENE